MPAFIQGKRGMIGSGLSKTTLVFFTSLCDASHRPDPSLRQAVIGGGKLTGRSCRSLEEVV